MVLQEGIKQEQSGVPKSAKVDYYKVIRKANLS